jgi:hypothetical protein
MTWLAPSNGLRTATDCGWYSSESSNGGQGSRGRDFRFRDGKLVCSSCKRKEKIVPVFLLWVVPARIFVGSTASYLVAMAELMDSTLARGVAQSTPKPADRRRKFRVIEGGKR